MTGPTSRSRVLVLRPRRTAEHGGDEVVYRHSIARIVKALPVDIEYLELQPRGGWRKYALLLSLPAEITAFANQANRDAVRARLARGGIDAVLLFNEITFPMLGEVTAASIPSVLVAHNVQSVVASSDSSPLLRAMTPIARRFERRYYGDRRAALVCISDIDVAGLRAAGIDRADIRMAPPGAPPETPLAPSAGFAPELVMTGSYGWWRKRRDLRKLAAEAEGLTAPLLVSDASALAVLGPHAAPVPEDLDWSSAIRFGIVSDRFLGGFKLKTLEYVARNCVVVTFCDLAPEFAGLPFADRFVRHVRHAKEIGPILLELARDPAAVEQFRIFKAACLERYAWDACLTPLVEATGDAIGHLPA